MSLELPLNQKDAVEQLCQVTYTRSNSSWFICMFFHPMQSSSQINVTGDNDTFRHFGMLSSTSDVAAGGDVGTNHSVGGNRGNWVGLPCVFHKMRLHLWWWYVGLWHSIKYNFKESNIGYIFKQSCQYFPFWTKWIRACRTRRQALFINYITK